MNRGFQRVLLVIGALMVLASLILSSLTFYGLLRARRMGLRAVEQARAALSGLSEREIDTTVPIHHTLPISAAVPLQQEFEVPIQTTIPISTTAQVPIQIPVVGTYQIEVPVETRVPIDLDVIVPVSQTVQISTSVTLDTEVPVHVEVEQLGLSDLLEQIDDVLLGVKGALRWPAPSSP